MVDGIQGNGHCLLIVDDNKHNRTILSHYFRKFGYQIITTESGNEVMQLLANNTIDLVLLDIVMPEMDGFEVLRKIRNQYSVIKMPVIMTTSLSENKDVIKALTLGANDYISKPIEPRVADARIQTHLNLKKLAEERDHLMDMTSHDIKKPVIIIEEITKTIQEENKDLIASNDSLAELLSLLSKTSSRLNTFVSDFLEMRVIENGNMVLNQSRCNLNALVIEVVVKLQTVASRKNITIETNLGDDLPIVNIDENRISQVLENLIGNAIKFSPQELKVIVSTGTKDGYVVCDVIDQGPGISNEDKPRLFKRFTSLSNKPTANESSTGLGLSICKDLIDMHQGTIAVENNVDKGANFRFTIPV